MSDDEDLGNYANFNPLVDRLWSKLNINKTDNELDDDFESDDEISSNSMSNSIQAYNRDANTVGTNSASGGNNTHPFINPGIIPNRFVGPINSPAIHSGQSHSSWNNRPSLGQNWTTNQDPEAIKPGTNTQFATAPSRFHGPRGLRGPRPSLGAAILPVSNHSKGTSFMPVAEANRFLHNARPMRHPSYGPIPLNTRPVGFNPIRPPIDNVVKKLADEINQSPSPIPVNRPPFQVGSRPPRPNLFLAGGNFHRPPSSNAHENRPLFTPGTGTNSHPFSVRGQIPPQEEERMSFEKSKAKLPSPVTRRPPNEEEAREIYDPPEDGDYELVDDDDGGNEMPTQRGPPELPPPRLPPPVRAPVMSSHPLFENKPVLPRYPSPVGINDHRFPNSTAPVHHPNDNIRGPNAYPSVTDEEVEPQIPPSLPSRVLPSLPSRVPPSSTPQPFWTFPRSSNKSNSPLNSHPPTESPLQSRNPPSRFPPPIIIRPPASQIPVQRTRSHEGVPPLKPLPEERRIETNTDTEGYEQILDHGAGPSDSYPTWPRNPAAVRGVNTNFPPMMPNPRLRMTHVVRPILPLMHLENGESFESTPLYENLLQEDFFHLISPQEVPRRLTQDGMFLFQPSRSRTDSNPLTLWLRYNGRNFKFSINRRGDGGYAIGKQKENEDRFYSIPEMAEHYRYDPLKFEGQQMFLRIPAAKL